MLNNKIIEWPSFKVIFLSLLSCLLFTTGFGNKLNNLSFDVLTVFFNKNSTYVHTKAPIVVVGVDENTFKDFHEPLALWHKHISYFVMACKIGNAKAITLDLVLPEKSFDFIRPGSDDSILKSISYKSDSVPLILGRTINYDGSPRAIYFKYEALVGEDHIGFTLFPIDADGVVRRFSEKLNQDGSNIPTLIGQTLRATGRHASEGFINFNEGGLINYFPIQTIVALYKSHDKDKLESIFRDKYVLLGSLLPAEDRLKLPINISGWEINNNNNVSGVLLHAQALKSILANKLIQPMSFLLSIILIIACTFFSLLDFNRPRSLVILFMGVLLVFFASVYVFSLGYLVPFLVLIFTILISSACAFLIEAIHKLRERMLLRKTFSGAVSPVLMREILTGRFNPKMGGQREQVCVLFADIRGFTSLSEKNSPEYIIGLLNRYFEGVVKSIHDESGVVLCFMGDGVMAVFGAPNPISEPEINAFNSALKMQNFVQELNNQLQIEGHQAIQIGIGIHSGEAIVGRLGSSTRNEYTVIGDVANLSSRLESLTKELNCGIAFSSRVNAVLQKHNRLDYAIEDYGVQNIKGRSPERVFGCSIA